MGSHTQIYSVRWDTRSSSLFTIQCNIAIAWSFVLSVHSSDHFFLAILSHLSRSLLRFFSYFSFLYIVVALHIKRTTTFDNFVKKLLMLHSRWFAHDAK